MTDQIACFPRGLRLWLGAFFIIGPALAGEAAAQTKVLRWHDRLEQAAKLSRESGKPIFAVLRCVR